MNKKLTRIRLINWHYFVNETISVNGSVLISGENTSGKSTILDAIQLVLTTNTKKFNIAANEKSNRDLKGYVRCKTGNENAPYVRTGSVITYVALEFYEEKEGRYFTIGVKIDSQDEESKLYENWFVEECKFESLQFLVGNRPSTNEEFLKDNNKVKFITDKKDIKNKISRRLGNLNYKFFDMIPKSLAFKPMDNVKQFINNYILASDEVKIDTLKENINTLKELENLMRITKEKIDSLKVILDKKDEIDEKDKEIYIYDVLIKKSELEDERLEIEKLENEAIRLDLKLKETNKKIEQSTEALKHQQKRENDLIIAQGQSEATKLIESIKANIEKLEINQNNIYKDVRKLDETLSNIKESLTLLSKINVFIVNNDEYNVLNDLNTSLEEKHNIFLKLKNKFKKLLDEYRSSLTRKQDAFEKQKIEKIELSKVIENLKNKKLKYPDNTVKLIEEIEKEFNNLSIESKPRIFSDLLEVSDSVWQNAVEGYLNTQRFYVIVEPRYYKTALAVYDRVKKHIHTVGLVNTEKLKEISEINKESLAYVVRSNNRWAQAYSDYLLKDVICCKSVEDLKNYKTAITSECMLYKNYAVRKIHDEVYKVPFIGEFAYQVQLKNKEAELVELEKQMNENHDSINAIKHLINSLERCDFNSIKDILNCKKEQEEIKENILKEKNELKKAENNPDYIDLQNQIEICRKYIDEIAKEKSYYDQKIGGLENEIKVNKNSTNDKIYLLKNLEQEFEKLCENNLEASEKGLLRFTEQIKLKSCKEIANNFGPVKATHVNKKGGLVEELMELQTIYITKSERNLGLGLRYIKDYNDEYHKLYNSDIVKYESDLDKAKEDTELQFKESFLAALKEKIDKAKLEFKELNESLKNIYYGEDTYKFELTYNKNKEELYKMITSDKNLDGYTMFSETYREEFKNEMEDLFSKLVAIDDNGDKIIKEYTDYRSYLDYDIIVSKKDGTSAKFSKIYGEKSGGETQTPYYVAIAASFVGLYKIGNTIRIMMFDEAFDKMDDNRISSMMDFLNSQNFQMIIATPPSKMEVIGEKVETILIASREGNSSFVYDYKDLNS